VVDPAAFEFDTEIGSHPGTEKTLDSTYDPGGSSRSSLAPNSFMIGPSPYCERKCVNLVVSAALNNCESSDHSRACSNPAYHSHHVGVVQRDRPKILTVQLG
jgi:hypothetical protein